MYSLVTEYEQDERVWGIAKDGVIVFVIDADEVSCPKEFGLHLVSLLNSNER